MFVTMRIVLLCAALCAACSAPPPQVAVMSFNIRYGTAADGPDAWPARRTLVVETIAAARPALLGVQEALHFQMQQLSAALPGHRPIGVGRADGDTAGEYAAIFVDTARFAIVAHGTFWLSDTPTVPGSMHWGNHITRICTWARLADRRGGDTLRVYNTHWDHESQASRERSAALVLARVAEGPPGDGVIVMGDFNAGEANPAFRALVAPPTGLTETFRALHPDDSIVGTFNGFAGTTTGEKIDAILVNSRFDVRAAAIVRRHAAGRYPSDHFPVTAEVAWRR